MSQNQELIGLQSELAKNLNLQENLKLAISLKERELSRLENEQEEIEERILELQGIPENTQGNKASFDTILNDIANDMLQGINIELDKNEQGETIQ